MWHMFVFVAIYHPQKFLEFWFNIQRWAPLKHSTCFDL